MTFTLVEIVFYPQRINHRLRFGAPIETAVIDRRRSLAFFAPGACFAYVRWRANEYGTQQWAIYIVRAGAPGERLQRVAGLRPGGDLLGVFVGAAAAKRFLQHADALEARGVDLADLSPAFWRQAQMRLPLRSAPHGVGVYDANLHRLKRRALS